MDTNDFLEALRFTNTNIDWEDDDDMETNELDTSIQMPVFVYGTLRPGHGNASLWSGLATARYDGHARVLGRRLVSNGGFPYMLHSTPSEQVVGTLIFPDAAYYEQVLDRMDMLEGVPVHYIRDTIAVICGGGVDGSAIFAAWTYMPVDDSEYEHLTPVTDNDWSVHRPPRFINYPSQARS